jgi:hypothetical protein
MRPVVGLLPPLATISGNVPRKPSPLALEVKREYGLEK